MAVATTSAGAFEIEDQGDFDERRKLNPNENQTTWALFGGLLLLIVLAYLDMLQYNSTFWSKGLYSHGWIVPLIAGYLFWIRRQPLVEAFSSERWAGVALLALSFGIRIWISVYDMNTPDRLTFIGALLGLCLLIGGLPMLKWAGPPLAFLYFMFPLPGRIETGLLMELQKYATYASTWVLQLLGVSATRTGNTIIIDGQTTLNVAEACSGLRMLTIFGAMTVALIMTMNRPWWDRLAILVLGWIPIALVSNVIRIVLTGLLFMIFGPETEWVKMIVHDWAGYAMMPIGLGLLAVEYSILTRVTTPLDDGDYSSFGTSGGKTAAFG